MDLDYQHAEISTIPPATATPAVINTAANTVAPPVTLHTDAGGHPLPAEASGPKTRSPLRPLVLECELAHYPDKAFVKQLISNLVLAVPLDTMDLNLQQMQNTSVQHCSTPLLSTNLLKKR